MDMASSAKPPAPGQTWAQVATRNSPVKISLLGDPTPPSSLPPANTTSSSSPSTPTTPSSPTTVSSHPPTSTSPSSSTPSNVTATPAPTSTIRTTTWRTGRNDGSYFLDLSSRSEGDSIIFQLIKKQFPSCRGAATI
ncbi:hypothetical protein BCR42DRAFT_443594 [Absidia repens]|uniref:Uncharacterized protein n=1 Tax=Absidia repens TaxID=90262 RepID=A0A1X2HZ31_9FUNG|nr:hypothetical protein BCR42DRAFT_443594 [Absidia repens]